MPEFLQHEFMQRAIVSAMILGPMCSFLGIFITLRGMSFFSDAIAHSAFTGVVLGILLKETLSLPIPEPLSVLTFSLAVAGLIAFLLEKSLLKADTVIALTFTGSVALGKVIISKLGDYRLLEGLLFGDIHANAWINVWIQMGLSVVLYFYLLWNMRGYVLATVQPELAYVEGYRPRRLNYLFVFLIAATVTVCLPMLGALLLSALIVIPPAAAKILARNFRQMLVWSVILGFAAAVTGVYLSYEADLDTGPSIVLTNVVFLVLALIFSRIRSHFATA